MARQLGHSFPLGAFRNLGSWVQRRSLGTSSLSILDLKTFYPRGFPAVESSANEPRSNTSANHVVARKIETSASDTQTLSDKRTPASASDTQLSSNKRTSNSVSEKQSAPFRAGLQRYFKPETDTATTDVSLSQKEVDDSLALTNQVKPDLATPSTPDLQAASAETTASVPASASTAKTNSTKSSLPARSKTSADNALQRFTNAETQTDKSDSSQSSVADITRSIQSLQISSSTPPANAIQSERQRTTDRANTPPAVEPNTSISAQQPGLGSIDINQSIQSLRKSSSSLQRLTGQHDQRPEQSSDLRTQPAIESKVSPTTSLNVETQPAQRPKAATPSAQPLNESTETPPSPLSLNQNPDTASRHNPGQPLQRQPDSTTAAISAQGSAQQATEQNATQPPNSRTAALPTHQAKGSTHGSIQRATEQNNTQLPSSGNDQFNQLNTHTRRHVGSLQSTTASNHLDISPKIQTALESSQIASSPTSSNSNTVQQQLASKDPVNIDNSPPDNPLSLVNNLPQVQPSSSQQRISQSAETEPIERISNAPIITNPAKSVQRVTDSAQQPTLDSLDPSRVSAQNLDNTQPVSDVTVQSAAKSSQSTTSPPLASESSSALQRTSDQSNITLPADGNDNPIQSVTYKEIQSAANPSAPSSDQTALSTDIQRASEINSTPAQAKPTSDNLDHLQRQPNIVAGDSTHSGSSLAVDLRPELPQPNATDPTLDSGGGALNITDPPTDLSSKLTASIQRSAVEFKNGRSIAEQPISQAQTMVDQNEIAPSPISQAPAHTEIQRSPNLSDTAISPTEVQQSLSPPTDRPTSATESITNEPSNIQSVANSVEAIQRTANLTQSPKLTAGEPLQTDITQLAADTLSETSTINSPSDNQPVTSSTGPVQRVAELPHSTLSTSNPNQIEETQKPLVTSNVNEEGTLSTVFFEASPIQRLSDKADNKLSPSESSSTKQASIVQHVTTPDNTHSGSLPENQSLSDSQPLTAAGSESTSITQEHRSDSPIDPDSIQHLSDSTALSPPQTAASEKTPRHKTLLEPLAASRPSIQPKAAPDVSLVKLDKIQKSADSSSPIHNHGLSDSSSIPKQSSSLSVTNQTLELQQTSSVPTESSIADPNPPNTLQRHTKSPQSTNIPEASTEATATVSNDQGTTALSETLSTDVGESIPTTSSSSNALQRQTNTLQSANIPAAQTESVAHVSGGQEAIEQSNVTSHLTRGVPEICASFDQSEPLQRKTAAPISQPTSHTSTPSKIQQAPNLDGLEIPLSSDAQHSFSTINSTTESDQPASQTLTTQKVTDPSKDTSTPSAKSQSTSEPQPWSSDIKASPTAPSTTSIQRVVAASPQTGFLQSEVAQLFDSQPGQTALENVQRVGNVRETDFSQSNSQSTVESSQLGKNQLSDNNLSESRQSQLTSSSEPSDIQRDVSSVSQPYHDERSDTLTNLLDLTQPPDTKRVQPSYSENKISTESSAPLLQRSSNITSDSINATIHLPEPGSKISSDIATTAQRRSDNVSQDNVPDTIASPKKLSSSSAQPSTTLQQMKNLSSEDSVISNITGSDIPFSSDQHRSLSAIDSVTENEQPASKTFTIQKTADSSQDTSPSITSAERQLISESQPWSSNTAKSSTASIQRVTAESRQTDTVQARETQSFESQPSQTALENIQQSSDVRNLDFSKSNSQLQIESSQLGKNQLSDNNLSEFKQYQLTSSDPSNIQRAVSNDSYSSYQDNARDGLTSSPERIQPTDINRVQPSDFANEVSAEKAAPLLQCSSTITSETIRLPGSKIPADTATQHLSNADTKGSPSLPVKALQQKKKALSRESVTSDLGIINQEVSDSAVQRSPNTPVADSHLSLGEPLSNKAQLSPTNTPVLPATDSLQPITDAVSVQRAPQDNSRQAETYSETVSESTLSPNIKSSPSVNSPLTVIQRDSLETSQLQSSATKTSLQCASDEKNQPDLNILISKSLPHGVLGSSSSNRLLPKVLQPLGILKPLPTLQTDKSAPIPSVLPQAQLKTVQRQVMPNAWVKNISRQQASRYPSTHLPIPEGFKYSLSQDKRTPPIPNWENVNNSIEESSETNPSAADIQRSHANTHASIQRRSNSDDIPSEWSNIEDLVTHLQSAPSDHISTKAAPTQQPPNSKQPTAKSASQPKSQAVKLSKPVTVQRQTISPSSTTTIIQACKDISPNAESANTDDQTDDNHNYSQYLELLAQEVYGLLRQRLSLEQERRGPKYPR